MEFTFKRKLIHWIFTQVFQNLEIWVCDVMFVVSTILQKPFCNDVEEFEWTNTFSSWWRLSGKLIFQQFFSFQKTDSVMMVFQPEKLIFVKFFRFPRFLELKPLRWSILDEESTLFNFFQKISFPRTETVKMLHSRWEKYTFQLLFSKKLVSSNWNR